MSVARSEASLRLPDSLQNQLHDFRRRVWTIKSIEAGCGALFGVVVAYLVLFGLDRLFDTPVSARLAIFAVAVAACAVVPVMLHRWIWRHRRLEQLARLLARKYPSLGDQLLGVIELVKSDAEQARSRRLCEAAIKQVADVASRRDFRDAVPNPRHRLWAWLAGVPLVAAALLLAAFPAAATNAWARFLAPWRPIDRYTFTMVRALPETVIVPHGEPVTVSVPLADNTKWQPQTGTAQVGQQPPVSATLKDGRYEFTLPGQIDSSRLKWHIGDAQQKVLLEPMHRPELATVVADVKLPEYLERPATQHKDIRGGSISLVKGSAVQFTATANRDLSAATVDGQAAPPAGEHVAAPPFTIADSKKLSFEWTDKFGLSGLEPFTVAITARDDEPPSVGCEDLPRQRVVLDSETLSFKVHAQDDFGVKRVGLEWQGLNKLAFAQSAKGERILAAGASDKETLDVSGTFCAQTLGIEAQPLNVRVFVEDFLPGRERVYSPTYTLYVLTAEEHAIWATEMLSKWHRQSLEVRDREMQLHHTNQQLRLLTPEELDQAENRRRLEAQSLAERTNGRRLTGLANQGEELIRQAMRNPEFGVGHLEKWAEMLQIMKDISANRMPNVADLLKQSAQSPGQMASAPSKPKVTVGQMRMSSGSGGPPKPNDAKPQPVVPQVVDAESSQVQKKDDGEANKPNPSQSKPRLTLPVTTVMGSGGKTKPEEEQPTPAAEKLDEAIVAQQDLLAEFEKIADELNKLLANLEGSTLVKRLKAASRQQYVISGKIAEQVSDAFGVRHKPEGKVATVLAELGKLEMKSSQDLSNIMDDMAAYFERRRMQRFKTVLDEMREEDAVGSLRQLGDDVPVEAGLSIAQSEFWSDTFDRWADNLVDPACSGKCPGCKSKSSLPPSIVLEAMQILEAEINLREETRVAEQARPALAREEYSQRTAELRGAQAKLSDRVAALTERILQLPDGESEFGKEIALLGRVELVMDEAAAILGEPHTGSRAIAAETEAIELLLQSKKINPKGGGGGGSSPGGGGTGDTKDPALALLGAGMNDKEVREDRGISQATGETGSVLPEEFRAGLDEYFNRLEREDRK